MTSGGRPIACAMGDYLQAVQVIRINLTQKIQKQTAMRHLISLSAIDS